MEDYEYKSLTETIEKLKQENQELKEVINKAIERLNLWESPECDKGTMREIQFSANKQNVLEILQGDSNE